MAYIQNDVLHETSVDEFKEIAKDFAVEMRRICPALKHTAALDLFTNLYYPNLSFSSAVPMINDAGTAKPLPLTTRETDLREAIDRSKLKVQSILSGLTGLDQVLPRWTGVVRSLFLTRYPPLSPKKKKARQGNFRMQLAVAVDEKDAFIEALKEAGGVGDDNPFYSNEEIARLIQPRYRFSPEKQKNSQVILLREDESREHDIYRITQDNPLNIEFVSWGKSPHLNRLCAFALYPALKSYTEQLSGCSGVHLAHLAQDQYDTLTKFRGKHEVADTVFDVIERIETSVKRNTVDEDFRSWGPDVSEDAMPEGRMITIRVGQKSIQHMIVFVSKNGVFIRNFTSSDPKVLFQPLDHIEVGDFFIKKQWDLLVDVDSEPSDPEVLEVVEKTEAGVKVRQIGYEMEYLGKGLPEQHSYRLHPKPGRFLSDTFYKDVQEPDFDSVISMEFKEVDGTGRETIARATHYPKTRVLPYSIFKED